MGPPDAGGRHGARLRRSTPCPIHDSGPSGSRSHSGTERRPHPPALEDGPWVDGRRSAGAAAPGDGGGSWSAGRQRPHGRHPARPVPDDGDPGADDQAGLDKPDRPPPHPPESATSRCRASAPETATSCTTRWRWRVSDPRASAMPTWFCTGPAPKRCAGGGSPATRSPMPRGRPCRGRR